MHFIGWLSSLILLATLVAQIGKQWKTGTKGVSKWLFIGQLAASIGFVVYSVSTRNVVFVVTNSLILVSALIGTASWFRNRNRERSGESEPTRASAPMRDARGMSVAR